MLAFSTRQSHYRKADPDTMLPSDSGSSSSESVANVSPARTRSESDMCVDPQSDQEAMGLEGDEGSGSERMRDISSGLDRASSQGNNVSDTDSLQFHEDDLADRDCLTLDEMYDELRFFLGHDNEQELYNIRKFLTLTSVATDTILGRQSNTNRRGSR